ncbi:MAG: aminoglycoside phosphotransferase family protein [Prevotella sp.]|jgi:Ser/Thr protein kinase RdoA (MazF antagonist)|nr:aminoglycoside phosphotransferase family protein [Prevotella sp.]MCI2087588.1 aminoglycoside phosphotransferase family protein [Prevotella sp.]MCI2125160.1 aminoglycoside phosphotransferase family protein [Prevotella sp.]
MEQSFNSIIGHFALKGTPVEVRPLGEGLINDTYKVSTSDSQTPDYVLQRINHQVFSDVDLLMHNIEVVTTHIRHKLETQGVTDVDRKVLTFMPATDGKCYFKSSDGKYWRMMIFISHAKTYDTVTPGYAFQAGKAFGHFESMLIDIPEHLGETIPDFHNIELRIRQLHDAVNADVKGRVDEVRPMIEMLEKDQYRMCRSERLYRQGLLPKRICHCDTKVNNMMFDENGNVLCVIDLDTVMPSFVFSDYGDFLRTGANFVAEDDPQIDRVGVNMEIFRSFTKGYLEGTADFLTQTERDNLPYAAALFPFMQCVRFVTDYINGDVYYKIKYPKHNLIRARNQWALYQSVCRHEKEMMEYINQLA